MSLLEKLRKMWGPKERPRNALDKAREMMSTPMNDVPPIAASFARLIANETGAGCMLYAYGAYAEIVLGLEPDPNTPCNTIEARSYFATAIAGGYYD